MFKNYIKLALRNLLRYKGYSLINITGLALGLAASMIIILYVIDELSYDRFHEKSDRIYRVSREWFNEDGTSNLHLARVAAPVAELLKNDYPDAIEESMRVFGGREMLFRRGEFFYIESRSYFAGPQFFRIFSYDLLRGDPEKALAEPFSVVLTESVAERYFRDEDPMGKMIEFDSPVSNDVVQLKVTGIMEDMPGNTHLKIDILISFETIVGFFGREAMTTNWWNNNYLTYLLLAPNYDVEDLKKEIPGFLDRHLGESYSDYTERTGLKPSDRNSLHLLSLTDIHLHGHLTAEAEPNSDIRTIYIFSIIAFMIILVACINFMNLSTARAGRRAKEIGLRKVMGAQRKQISFQFLGESILITFIAMFIGLLIVELTLPAFNRFLDKSLTLFGEDSLIILGIALALALITGLLSGSYPAIYLSSFRPYSVIKYSSGRRSGLIRKVLVVFQFSTSIALIVAVIVIYSQMQLLREKDLGYEREEVMQVEADQQFFNKLEAFRSEVMKNPKVRSVTRSSLIPSDMLVNNAGGATLDGEELLPLSFRLAVIDCDYEYFKTYKINFAEGRPFSKEYGLDDSLSFILNETAVKRLGWDPAEAVGKPFAYGGKRGRIIGVTKDFYFESLHNEIVPVIFRFGDPGNMFRLSIRVHPEGKTETIRFIEEVYSQTRPGYPFNYQFIDEILYDLYDRESNQAVILGLFTVLSLVIACLGLLGLASFTAEQRTREIGVRKVFGASAGDVVLLLSKEFLKWVLIANIIAWPVAYLLMEEWLSNFAYSIDMSVWIFLASAVVALLIALTTVILQAYRAANLDPVRALRYE